MARKVQDAILSNRTARLKLKAGVKPYYRMISPGLHIGYRRLEGAGTWVVRRYEGKGKYSVLNLRTQDDRPIVADDHQDADGISIMTFAQAQEAAGAPSVKLAHFTIAEALNDYLNEAIAKGRSDYCIRDIRYRIGMVNGILSDVSLSRLTRDDVTKLRNGLASAPPRKRTARGDKQQFRDAPADDDAKRARRATANRTFAMFKAAMNMARKNKKVLSDEAWRDVEMFEKVSAARIRYLSVAEAQRLVNACAPDFRLLVRGALATGCRYGELCALVVADFDSDNGTVHIRRSKSGHPRHAVLDNEGIALFRSLVVGKVASDPIFTKPRGNRWRGDEQKRPMEEAKARAGFNEEGIPRRDRIGFNTLRHTWASLSVMAGMPLMVVQRQLGHRDTRMVEQHYGHLAPSYVANTIRQHAPKFGFESDSKVTAIR